MNPFEEFIELAQRLEKAGISYAVVGGVALAFHGHARFTQDVDILIKASSLERLSEVLKATGYRSFTPAWEFGQTGIHLHRWLRPHPEDEVILDVLAVPEGPWAAIVDRAQVSEHPAAVIHVARREDLIALKRLRNSKQDEADIEALGGA